MLCPGVIICGPLDPVSTSQCFMTELSSLGTAVNEYDLYDISPERDNVSPMTRDPSSFTVIVPSLNLQYKVASGVQYCDVRVSPVVALVIV